MGRSTRAPFPLPTTYGLERDVLINSSRLINIYSVPANHTTQKSVWYPASGYENPEIIGNGSVREQFVFRETQYLVSGDAVYSRNAAGTVTFLGNISASGYVGITANEKEVIFVNGTNGYLWNTATNMFSTIAFGFPINPVDVCMLDNYFIIPDFGEQKFYISALNNGASWSSTNFAIFQSNPDSLVACHILKRRLYLFGQHSIETWYDAGDPVFPFRRDNNALFEHGCLSPGTIKEGFEVMLYLANNKDGTSGVMLVEGVSYPKKVSSNEIDLALQAITNPADSDAILYKENGLTYYQLNFTTDNKTFVYVLESNRWHELSLPNGDRHPAISHSYLDGRHFIGTNDSTAIFELSYKFFTYNKELIRCFLITPQFFTPTNNRIRIDRFQVEATTGLAGVTLPIQNDNSQVDDLIKQNESAEIILSVSRDGGRTFSNGRRESMGIYGDFLKQIYWRGLGVEKGRRIVISLEFPYEIPFIVLGAYADYRELPE